MRSISEGASLVVKSDTVGTPRFRKTPAEIPHAALHEHLNGSSNRKEAAGAWAPFSQGGVGQSRWKASWAVNNATRAAEGSLDGEAESHNAQSGRAREGRNPWARRLCLERILPARRDRPLDFQLPPIETAADAATALALVAAVAKGEEAYAVGGCRAWQAGSKLRAYAGKHEF